MRILTARPPAAAVPAKRTFRPTPTKWIVVVLVDDVAAVSECAACGWQEQVATISDARQLCPDCRSDDVRTY